MRIALVNPAWDFAGSIYFGCHEPHLPLELGYTRALLERDGHDVLLLDGPLCDLSNDALAQRVAEFAPAMTVVATAPTYLFWRCPPPELRIPADFLRRLGKHGGRTVAVGPHGSTTPASTLRKLGVDTVVRGECEEVVAELAGAANVRTVPATVHREDGAALALGPPHASGFVDHPPLQWPDEWIARHGHHHHRFDTKPSAPGAEVEASRGCPYACSFCAKLDYRDKYRRRRLPALMEEIDRLIGQGARYLYFIDEIFLPNRPLLDALAKRRVAFGIQTRIDLWSHDLLERLGRAGCVSIEAGVESLTEEGRAALDKRCRMTNEELSDRLLHARRHVPFVQANLLDMTDDDPQTVAAWRDAMREHGVWANDPVPLFPYPASPHYRKLWGEPDERAWERAHEHYLKVFARFSDIQEAQPAALGHLEASCHA